MIRSLNKVNRHFIANITFKTKKYNEERKKKKRERKNEKKNNYYTSPSVSVANHSPERRHHTHSNKYDLKQYAR